MIRKFLSIMVVCIVIAALYKAFGGDIGLAVTNTLDALWGLVDNVSTWLASLPLVRDFLGT